MTRHAGDPGHGNKAPLILKAKYLQGSRQIHKKINKKKKFGETKKKKLLVLTCLIQLSLRFVPPQVENDNFL